MSESEITGVEGWTCDHCWTFVEGSQPHACPMPGQGYVEVHTPVHINDMKITGITVDIADLKRITKALGRQVEYLERFADATERLAVAAEKAASLLHGWMESHP